MMRETDAMNLANAMNHEAALNSYAKTAGQLGVSGSVANLRPKDGLHGCVEQLHALIRHADRHVECFNALADKLGGVPVTGNAAGSDGRPVRSGVLGQIEDAVDTIRQSLLALEATHQRLHKLIGE